MEVSYYYSKKILTIGSGDASFEVALVKLGIKDICVTFYDTQDRFFEKYGSIGERNIHFLDQMQISLFFEVDATELNKNFQGYDLIIWNFPHNGESNETKNSGSKWNSQTIKQNQKLLRKFFHSAKNVGEEIHISLGTRPPYSHWNIDNLAKGSHFRYVRSSPFNKKLEELGYVHRSTVGNHIKVRSKINKSKVYCFQLMNNPWCKKFLNGKCRRGKDCPFLHDLPEQLVKL